MDYVMYLMLKTAVLTALNAVPILNAPKSFLTAYIKYLKLS